MIRTSLRLRLAVLAVVGVELGVVLAATGYTIAARPDAAAAVDRQLRDLAERAVPLAAPAVEGDARARRDLDVLAGGGAAQVAVLDGDRPLVVAGSDPWPDPRRVDVPVPGRSGWSVRAAVPADRVEQTVVRQRRLLTVPGLLAALVAGLLTWFAAGRVVRPLHRLAAAAARSGDGDLRRVSIRSGPTEVVGLARDVDGMLDRLEHAAADRRRALEASRRFAADVGHELRTPLTALRAELSTLSRPDLAPADRAAVAAGAAREHRRLVEVLDMLQALARAEADPPAEPVDLAEIVDGVVLAARAAHPAATVDLVAPDDPVPVAGSATGLRLVVDNLVRNAALHGAAGRAAFRVEVRLGREDGWVVLDVDDDGPGVAAADRTRVVGRFVRGPAARGDGSGLGLAVADQEARRHGGLLTVGEAPLGGARVRVRFPEATR